MDYSVTNTETLQNTIHEALSLIDGLDGTKKWKHQLIELSHAVAHRQHLVAVFGAFSAGKSSLINALVQKQALVVSPNPTTAAVTHVRGLPGNDGARVQVSAKTREQLWEDVQQALLHIHESADSMHEALALVKSLQTAKFAPSAKKFVTFLQAVASGYPEMEGKLGQTWEVDEEGLHRFTAEERYACFVQRVNLATDADVLASSGMVLVDTPGVDSIHRRHTDVAFQYMRQADAIIFVLYYTHAFTRADKEFLRQLSSVQDIVGTEKLFVVINAVDLAENDEERLAVRQRVEGELKQQGIRHPRIYEVSSQLANAATLLAQHPGDERFENLLRAKLGLDATDSVSLSAAMAASGIPVFQSELSGFIKTQAATLMNDAVRRRLSTVGEEVERSFASQLRRFEQDTSVLEAQGAAAAEMYSALASFRDAAADGDTEFERGLETEWDELQFHISDRIRIGFAGLFREAFHPGRFRIAGQDKAQLQESAEELMETISRQIEAEIRTFGLRAHQQMVDAVQHARTYYVRQLQERGLGFIAMPDDMVSEDVPTLPHRVNLAWDTIRPVFRHYRSSKQFFENGGQQAMLQAAEPLCLDVVRQAVDALSSDVRQEVLRILRRALEDLASTGTAALRDISTSLQVADDQTLRSWERAAAWFSHYRNEGVAV